MKLRPHHPGTAALLRSSGDDDDDRPPPAAFAAPLEAVNLADRGIRALLGVSYPGVRQPVAFSREGVPLRTGASFGPYPLLHVDTGTRALLEAGLRRWPWRANVVVGHRPVDASGSFLSDIGLAVAPLFPPILPFAVAAHAQQAGQSAAVKLGPPPQAVAPLPRPPPASEPSIDWAQIAHDVAHPVEASESFYSAYAKQPAKFVRQVADLGTAQIKDVLVAPFTPSPATPGGAPEKGWWSEAKPFVIGGGVIAALATVASLIRSVKS